MHIKTIPPSSPAVCAITLTNQIAPYVVNKSHIHLPGGKTRESCHVTLVKEVFQPRWKIFFV